MSAPDPRCQSALERLLASGAVRIDPLSVLPARDVLELSGESIRYRLCAFPDNSGGELAMRPDMTTPIAMMLAGGEIGSGRYAYCGDVYRLPRTGRHDEVEFEQVGFEWFGEDGPDADAEAFGEAAAMMKAAGAAPDGVVIGDVGLFHAVVDALEFSPDWADRLKRSFARMRGPAAVLDAARGASGGASDSLKLGKKLANLNREDARRAVEEIIGLDGVPVFAGRTVSDIAERLIARASSAPPDSEAAAALNTYLAIRAPAAAGVEAVSRWAKAAGVDLSGGLDRLQRRSDTIAAISGDEWKLASFDAELGRRFEYYDSFAFELSVAGHSEAPLVSGGRYDGLIARIDSGKSVSAIGAAMRADRLPGVGAGS